MQTRDGKTFEKSVNLALQGGGAHGAFTWGVLDRFLEDGRIYIEAISGTSAGAMNAVVLADGLMKGREEGARSALETFWKAVSEAGRFSPIQRSPINMWLGNWSLDNSPTYAFFDTFSRLVSPYDYNPLDINPLRTVVEASVDFDRVRSCDRIDLHVSATNVETGRVRVFTGDEINLDAVMASACLPYLFKAVEIDGTPYWDGGYMGNPVLFPFYGRSDSSDIIVVQINPVERKGTPKSAQEILSRMNEITFNSSLLKEFRAIEFVATLLDEGKLNPAEYKHILLHLVEAHDALMPLGSSSKVNSEWEFLRHLFEIGRNAADSWLSANFEKIGVESTIDIRAMFQGDSRSG